MKLIQQKQNRGIHAPQHGFTLVELLCVLVILGVLASIVLPKFTHRTEDAKIAAAHAQISIFETALSTFEVDMGRYPKGRGGLSELRVRPRDGQGWKGPYLEHDVPVDPWHNPYVYECPGRHNPTSFDIYSMGPDGHGGDNVIGNWTQATR